MKGKILQNAVLGMAMVLAFGSLTGCSGGLKDGESLLTGNRNNESVADSVQMKNTEETLGSTPREETLYLAGMFSSKPNDYNPLSSNSNLGFINQSGYSGEIMYETLFMFNAMTGQLHPLIGQNYEWNKERTEMTVTLNSDAKWSDGSDVTANDVAYTFDTHIKYNTTQGANYGAYIDKIQIVDPKTCVIKAKLNETGQAVNPYMLEEYLCGVYVLQKNYLKKVEERNNSEPEKVKTDRMEDLVTTAAYILSYESDQKIVLERNDEYWGQTESMWGCLPAPKYIASSAYKDNSAIELALKNGEVDVADLFIPNINALWEDEDLPISTYLPEKPYNIATAGTYLFFNQKRKGLDNVSVRKAIAMAIDYDLIVSSATTNQITSFKEVPRSIVGPSEGEQAMIDNEALMDVQFLGGDIEGANELLDEAGIIDTDGDGYRELDGEKLSFQVECPNSFSDWCAALEIVASCGQEIGIEIETYFPERAVWVNDYSTGNFDMAMANTVIVGA